MLVLDALGGETSYGGYINDAGLVGGSISRGPFEPPRATVWDTARF